MSLQIIDYTTQRNPEWTLPRLRRLKYMMDWGYTRSLMLESFICDPHHLDAGKQMLSWYKSLK